jgi:hypothetical protein
MVFCASIFSAKKSRKERLAKYFILCCLSKHKYTIFHLLACTATHLSKKLLKINLEN